MLSVLADNQVARCVLNRQMAKAGAAQDARSVAYVMVEMLTGMRIRGHLLERERLLSHVASEASITRDFLLALLQSSSLEAVADHPYLVNEGRARNSLENDAPENGDYEQRAVAGLVEQELIKCREMRRRHLGEVRAWLTQFEKRNERKPTASEHPRSVTLLQRQCRALSERMREIETQLAGARKSFYRKHDNSSIGRQDEGVEQLEHVGRFGDPLTSPTAETTLHPRRLDSTLGVLPAIDVSIRNGGALSDAHRRSPAQNAFLKRLEPQAARYDAVAGAAPADADDDLADRRFASHYHSVDIVSERVTGHHIIHQRKEVMHVINTIASAGAGAALH